MEGSMNTAKVSAALNTLSLGIAELAEALSDGTEPVLAAPGAELDHLRVPGGFVAEDMGTGWSQGPQTPYEDLPLPAETPGLGRCPSHNLAWSVKAAGVSKMGKPYSAFFHCDGKEPDGSFCPRKPVKAWADAHPIAA